MGRESEGRGVCLAYVGIACCLKGGLLFSFREGPQGLEPHALPGAARPSGCNGREREREKPGNCGNGVVGLQKTGVSLRQLRAARKAGRLRRGAGSRLGEGAPRSSGRPGASSLLLPAHSCS